MADGNHGYAVDTPNLDRLATEGMLFHQARIMGADNGAVCKPSRTMLMTGKNTWQSTNGVTAAKTLPGIFNRGVRTGQSAQPYATYRTCKAGNSYPTANVEFTIVNDAIKRGNTDGNGSEWHGDWGVNYISDWAVNHRGNSKPFLIYLGFSHPHDERLARETPSLTGRYGCINTTVPYTIPANAAAPPLPMNYLYGTTASYPAHPFNHGGLNVRDEIQAPGILKNRTENVVRNEIGRNYACVDWIDQQIGRVLARLDDPDGDGDISDSELHNTYIIFTADHGIAIGRHGLQGKQNAYEHTLRVPYIVRGPGITAGSESDAIVYLHDTFPTLCDLAGLDIPSTIDANDGQSFRAVLEGASSSHRDIHYGLYAGSSKPGIRSVSDGRFKLIKYDVENNGVQVTQLFDLQQNPFELLPEHGTANLATQPAYALIRQRLEEKLQQQRIENADPYAFLGDRTLFRFENGVLGAAAGNVADRLAFGHDGTAASGTGGALPVYSGNVPAGNDYVVGESNQLSLDLEQDHQQYVEVQNGTGLSFGEAPFTIEAWVKLETLPSGNNLASTMPVVQKKVIGAADSAMDYMLLAAAGSYGGGTNFSNMALMLGGQTIVSSLSIPDTQWHHISVSFDPVADVVRFTLDGQVDSQSTNISGTENTGPLVIGAHFNSSGVVDRAFDGLIDELSITDGFLAISELQPLQSIAAPDAFKIVSTLRSGTQVTLTFESSPLYLYDVESSSDLISQPWKMEKSLIQGSNGTTAVQIEVPEGVGRLFFRVRTSRYQEP